MNKKKMNLQQFADRYGLEAKNGRIQGPQGNIIEIRGLFNVMYGNQFQLFNPVTQARKAIEEIGLQYKAPPKPIKKDRKAFLIVKRTDGWYVADKAGPFKTRELARMARESLKNNHQETPKKTT